MGRLRRLAATIAAAATAIDARDLTLYAGLGLLGYGLYQVFPPAAFVAPGAILVCVAVFGVR